MIHNLENRPKHYEKPRFIQCDKIEDWFDGFGSELRSLKKGDKGVYVVTYVDGREPTVYIGVKEILGE